MQQKTLQKVSQLLCIAGLSALLGLTAKAQERLHGDDYYRTVIALSDVLGKSHAIRAVCNGSDDQHWRTFMLDLLALEAPYAGGLRRSMVNSFNAGFSTGSSMYRVCDRDAKVAEQAFVEEGQSLSAELVAANMPKAPR